MIVSSLKSWHLFGCEIIMMWERAGAASSQVPIFLNKPHGPGNSENGRGEMWDCDLSQLASPPNLQSIKLSTVPTSTPLASLAFSTKEQQHASTTHPNRRGLGIEDTDQLPSKSSYL